MAYTEMPYKGSTDTFSSSDWTVIKENFEASIPHLFTAAGDIAVATGSQAMDNLAIGTHHQVLQSRAASSLGVEWASLVGVFCSTDSVSIQNNVNTAVPFYTELYDSNSFHEVSPTTDADYITIPFEGVYIMSFTASWAANATGIRSGFIVYDVDAGGKTYTASAVHHEICYTVIEELTAGSLVYLYLYQNSGGALAATNVTLGVYLLR